MNAKISVFVICFKAIIYVLLYNLHDGTFNMTFDLTIIGNIATTTLKFGYHPRTLREQAIVGNLSLKVKKLLNMIK